MLGGNLGSLLYGDVSVMCIKVSEFHGFLGKETTLNVAIYLLLCHRFPNLVKIKSNDQIVKY